MENAVDALHMAFGVFIFVLALSVSINAFGEARLTSELVLNYQDREYYSEYVQENKDSDGNILTERIVGLENIIPTIYKAYKENYKIVFKDIELYQKYNVAGQLVSVHSIDLEKDVIGSDSEKEEFLKVLLNGARRFKFTSKIPKIRDILFN